MLAARALVSLPIPRRSEAGAGGLPPSGHSVLLPAHVRDGRGLLPEDPVPLSGMAAEPQGGLVLCKSLLSPGPTHVLPAEGKNQAPKIR